METKGLIFLKNQYRAYKHNAQKIWSSGNSYGWKSLVWSTNIAKHQIKWNINNGNINFWWDRWTIFVPLALIPFLYSDKLLDKLCVKDFMLDGRWDERTLSCVLPANIVQSIMNMDIGHNDQDDDPIWTCTEDGHYSNKSGEKYQAKR